MISDDDITRLYDGRKLLEEDFLQLVKPLLREGYWFMRPDGKIIKKRDEIQPFTLWYHVRSCAVRRCEKYHGVLFGLFGIIPEFCFDCRKVVVRPRNVVELFKLLETLKALPEEVSSKCGVEGRKYVPERYGGYVYALGSGEGEERLRLVREAVSEKIGPDVPVALKTGCTEFALKFGDPDGWEYRREWKVVEEWVDHNMEVGESVAFQPDCLQKSIMADWIRFARDVGDESVTTLTGGEMPAG